MLSNLDTRFFSGDIHERPPVDSMVSTAECFYVVVCVRCYIRQLTSGGLCKSGRL